MPGTYSVGGFADEVGVHVQTVKKWCRENDIEYTTTPGGDRRIPKKELTKLTGQNKPEDKAMIYARVSSYSQKENGDLDRQIQKLNNYAENQNWTVEKTYKDVGSGLNEDRRQLNKMLDEISSQNFGRILITYQDRLTRFGYSYLERYIEDKGVEITVVEDETDTSMEQELVDDMIKLVASFSGKLYGDEVV